MMNLLFSPSGRINSAEFRQGALILIVLGFLFNISPMINYQLSMILGIVGLVFIWCWIVLWIKRYHDSGKSGWMCLLPIVLFIVLAFIISMVVQAMGMAGIDPETQAAIEEMANEAAESGDIGGMFSQMMGMGAEVAKKTALPNALMTALASAIIAFGFNAIIKSEPNENSFGPYSG